MSGQNLTRTLTGKVIRASSDKTIVIEVKRRVKHALLGKYITKTSKIHAHDEKNQCTDGDSVLIQEGRPISKMKSWYLSKVIEKAKK